jgi:hypothetical protein
MNSSTPGIVIVLTAEPPAAQPSVRSPGFARKSSKLACSAIFKVTSFVEPDMSNDVNNQDQPATKRALNEALPQTRHSVPGKENASIWKAIALQVALIAAMAAAQWLAFAFHILHWRD